MNAKAEKGGFGSNPSRVEASDYASNRLVHCQFGTFDVDNYGDLLYPILLGKMLEARSETGDPRKFSLMGSESLLGAGYGSSPIQGLLSVRRGQNHALAIGGGDLLRTDALRVASHYESVCSRRTELPVPFSWRRLFRRLRHRPEGPDRRFWFRYMNYPAVGPFIIDPDKFPNIDRVSYISVGVPFAFQQKVNRRVARAMDKAGFIYVRDRQSERKLRDAGVTREIQVAPDLAVMLGEFFDATAGRAKGRLFLGTKGVDTNKRILCVQSNPQPPESRSALVQQLTAYKAATKCEVILLPLGLCHGDNVFLSELAQTSRGSFRYLELNSIFEMMSVIAASDVFLGTSLHGNITAFAFGIPHVIGPVAADKCEGFLDIANLPPELKLKSWEETNARLDFAVGSGGAYFQDRAVAARKRVNDVFDLMVRAVLGQEKIP